MSTSHMQRKQSAFLTAGALSHAGTMIALLATTVMAADSAPSPSQAGFRVSAMLSLAFTGAALGLPYTSVLTSRLGTRRAYASTLVTSALIYAGVVVLLFAGVQPYPVLLVTAPFVGALTGLRMPLNQMMLRSYSEPDKMRSSEARFTMVGGIAAIVGAPVAGIMIDTVGPLWCLVVNCLSYMGLILVAALVSPITEPALPGAVHAPWRSAVRALKSQRELRRAALAGVLAASVLGPLLQLIVPVARVLGHGLATHAGLMLACVHVGAILTPIVVTFAARRPMTSLQAAGRGYAFAGVVLIVNAMLIVALSGTVEFLALCAVLIAFGLFYYVGNSFNVAGIQEVSCDENRVLNMSVYFLAVAVGMPVGLLIWGQLIDRFGAEAAILTAGCAACAAMVRLSISLSRERRRVANTAPDHEPARRREP